MYASPNPLFSTLLAVAVGGTFVAANAPNDARAELPYRTGWDDQFGTSYVDFATAISVDALSNSYVSGVSGGVLDGVGPSDVNAFLAKYDPDGDRVWTRQDSTGVNVGSEFNVATGVSADGLGNVYLSGTFNSVEDDCCDFDLYLSKYDDSGNLAWTETIRSDFDEESVQVSADQIGNVFVGGTTYGSIVSPPQGSSDGFIAKYNNNGGRDWIRQFGGNREDQVLGISADGLGNVYLAGYQESQSGSYDAYVTKFGNDGTQLWTSYLGSAETLTLAFDVHADGLGNVYIAGQSDSDLASPPAPAFLNQGFVARFDDDGQFLWADTLDLEPGFARATGVTTDTLGIVHVVGSFDDVDSTNAFVEKFTPNGMSLGKQVYDSGEFVTLSGIDTDGQYVYSVGSTRDSLFRPNPGEGESDAIIVRLLPIPEPAGFTLAVFAALVLPPIRRRRRH